MKIELKGSVLKVDDRENGSTEVVLEADGVTNVCDAPIDATIKANISLLLLRDEGDLLGRIFGGRFRTNDAVRVTIEVDP